MVINNIRTLHATHEALRVIQMIKSHLPLMSMLLVLSLLGIFSVLCCSYCCHYGEKKTGEEQKHDDKTQAFYIYE